MWGAILSWLKGALSSAGSGIAGAAKEIGAGSGVSGIVDGIKGLSSNGMNLGDMKILGQGLDQANMLNQQQLSKNQVGPLPNYSQPQQNPYASVYMQYRR